MFEGAVFEGAAFEGAVFEGVNAVPVVGWAEGAPVVPCGRGGAAPAPAAEPLVLPAAVGGADA